MKLAFGRLKIENRIGIKKKITEENANAPFYFGKLSEHLFDM